MNERKNKTTDTDNRLMVTRGECGGGNEVGGR